ncbi:pyridoxamine 5'-phosphate oxidase family protein [Streptomyces chiangmaiensis]|uniref:Pyridoxamine 5'-phosphate oxidase family protein n=1 Tax=Streptomyces chiangmaiensis TaxID=766497 RepID=A0ABU7FTG5_9ACTN|nr:pyridoxamine 5'-phosphate oxidase family protein [Streptomyces chiangmaiensis]MED7827107.1 pyridoxamine 5'-phosphate oxidase family protein [Streptomyces chiangmaiensis]
MLAGRSFAVFTARDHDSALWTSPIAGEPGFLVAGGTALTVHATPTTGDPPHNPPVPQHVGLLAIDFGIRRRIRVNGELTGSSADTLTVHADQAFGNCPSYIQQRHLTTTPSSTHTTVPGHAHPHTATDAGALEDEHIELIRSADTFFLGTAHPTRGADASHKGGRPGFVRVEGREIWWPDYAGNNLFNSLGNITVDPATALLFIDFTTGGTLQLSGDAQVEWLDPSADEGGTGRRVRFTPRRIRTGTVALHGDLVSFSPHNPAVRTSQAT